MKYQAVGCGPTPIKNQNKTLPIAIALPMPSYSRIWPDIWESALQAQDMMCRGPKPLRETTIITWLIEFLSFLRARLALQISMRQLVFLLEGLRGE
jgi:hypothetical protein